MNFSKTYSFSLAHK